MKKNRQTKLKAKTAYKLVKAKAASLDMTVSGYTTSCGISRDTVSKWKLGTAKFAHRGTAIALGIID